MTETEDRLIAALANIGLSSSPNTGIEHPGRQRHAQHVVEEGEEQVLPDVAQRGLAQPPGPGDAAQIPLHQRHPGALHGDVRARAHGDAHVRLSQRRRVVDAISRHRHHPALGLEPLHHVALGLGQHLGDHLVDAQLARHRLRRGAAVAREHHHAQALLAQQCERLGRGGLDGIRHAEQPRGTAVHHHEDHRLSLAPQRLGQRGQRSGLHLQRGQERRVAQPHGSPVHAPGDALARERAEVTHRRQHHAALLRLPPRWRRPAGARWRAPGSRPAAGDAPRPARPPAPRTRAAACPR